MMRGKQRLTLRELPDQERPREKLLSRGERSLSEAELIAIVLGSGTVDENALQIAQRILKQAGSLKALSDYTATELLEFNGIGIARAAQVKAAFELARRVKEQTGTLQPMICNSKTVFQEFESLFFGAIKEEFWSIAMNSRNKVIHKDRISEGTITGSLVHPREVFRHAIRNSAAAIIVLHNHPSGDPQPSAEDRRVTSQLAEAGRLLGIPLFDHVIIGAQSYYSFKDAGHL